MVKIETEHKTLKSTLNSKIDFLVWPVQETDSKDLKVHGRLFT